MMLYPPFHITIKGTEINMGYGFLFAPPKRGYLDAFVNVPVLLAQWIAAILVGSVGLCVKNCDSVPAFLGFCCVIQELTEAVLSLYGVNNG
jgi:hypothetical protein